MVRHALLLLPLSCVAAFTAAPINRIRPNGGAPLFGGGHGGASSSVGKAKTVDKIKQLLSTSDMIFSVPASAISVAESRALRLSMPEGTTVAVVKNTLMNRALEGTQFETAKDLLKGANMWVFIEEDIGASIKSFKAFQKEKQKLESHPILGGVLESNVYDGAGVMAIGDLPSKDELYARIARSILMVPTKVARVVKAPGDKLARAIKLATDENNKN
jgi:large subunit ribosomal protein L10